MKIKDYKCKCGKEDFFIAEKGKQLGIYCSSCGKWFKWADKDEKNLRLRNTALDMAIKALEPCEDCISRKSAILEIQRYDADDFNLEQAERFVINKLNDLPSIQPKAKVGRWISIYGNVKCSVCGNTKDGRSVGKATHYCDFCGAKMEVEE